LLFLANDGFLIKKPKKEWLIGIWPVEKQRKDYSCLLKRFITTEIVWEKRVGQQPNGLNLASILVMNAAKIILFLNSAYLVAFFSAFAKNYPKPYFPNGRIPLKKHY
jgi:hypothetical protein